MFKRFASRLYMLPGSRYCFVDTNILYNFTDSSRFAEWPEFYAKCGKEGYHFFYTETVRKEAQSAGLVIPSEMIYLESNLGDL